jgi:hypothetical protein
MGTHFHDTSIKAGAIALAMVLHGMCPASAEVVTKARQESVRDMLFPFSKSAASSSPEEYVWNGDELDYVVQKRMWELDSRMMVGLWYDDNLFLDDGVTKEPVGDYYFSVNPSFDLSFGPNDAGLAATLYYNIEKQWYIQGKTDDAINQALAFRLLWTGAKARAYLGLSWATVNGNDVDVGTRLKRDGAQLTAGASYILGAKTTVGVGFQTTLREYSGGFSDSIGYSASAYADYQFSPKTSFGIGAGYGFTEVDGSEDYRFHEAGEPASYHNYDLNLRATWAAASRLTVSGTAGVQLNETAYEQEYTPVFSIDIDYDLLGDGKTSAKLSTYRDFHPAAALRKQAYWTTGIALDLSHALTDRTRIGLGVGYEFADYVAITYGNRFPATREDRYYYVRPNITYALNERISLSFLYQLSVNDSEGFGAASFERNWMGVTLNAAF